MLAMPVRKCTIATATPYDTYDRLMSKRTSDPSGPAHERLLRIARSMIGSEASVTKCARHIAVGAGVSSQCAKSALEGVPILAEKAWHIADLAAQWGDPIPAGELAIGIRRGA